MTSPSLPVPEMSGDRAGLVGPADCHGDVCITCSDMAVAVQVVELRPGDLALVDTGSTLEEVSVALVDTHVGGRILVHAKEAIAALPDEADEADEEVSA